MSPDTPQVILYWDASAILSTLFADPHSAIATEWVSRKGLHLISSLAWAEVHAVSSRVRREGVAPQDLVDAALDALEAGPWRKIRVLPAWELVRDMAAKYPLRGADLWHLAAASTLHRSFPEMVLVTFDRHLLDAARAEGFAAEYGRGQPAL